MHPIGTLLSDPTRETRWNYKYSLVIKSLSDKLEYPTNSPLAHYYPSKDISTRGAWFPERPYGVLTDFFVEKDSVGVSSPPEPRQGKA